MIKKSPPENFAYVRSPPDFFLAFLLNIIIPRKSPPEEENALKNAPLKYAWRSQCPPEIEKSKINAPLNQLVQNESVSPLNFRHF